MASSDQAKLESDQAQEQSDQVDLKSDQAPDQGDRQVREFEITIRVSERELVAMTRHLAITQEVLKGTGLSLMLSEQIYQRIIAAVITRRGDGKPSGS